MATVAQFILEKDKTQGAVRLSRAARRNLDDGGVKWVSKIPWLQAWKFGIRNTPTHESYADFGFGSTINRQGEHRFFWSTE